MNQEFNSPENFFNHLLSSTRPFENFVMAFVPTDKFSGTFVMSYFSTGRQFTGRYMLTDERYSRITEITLFALREKFWIHYKGEIKATHYIVSDGSDLTEKLNSIIDIY